MKAIGCLFIVYEYFIGNDKPFKQLNQSNSVGLSQVQRISEPSSISNENFIFITNQANLKQSESSDHKQLEPETYLQSPVESHFAVTPVESSERSSPANGFVSKDSTDLLNEELDLIDSGVMNMESVPQTPPNIASVASYDTLLSPTEENISMFSLKTGNEGTLVGGSLSDISDSMPNASINRGEVSK